MHMQVQEELHWRSLEVRVKRKGQAWQSQVSISSLNKGTFKELVKTGASRKGKEIQ